MSEGSGIEVGDALSGYGRNTGKGVADPVEKENAAVATLRVAILPDVGVIHSEGISALLDECSRDSPAAGDEVCRFMVAEILLALTERKLVRDDALEGMRDVKV